MYPETFIRDIGDTKHISGISYKRLEIIKGNLQLATGYELRMLCNFLNLYIYQFEFRYGIKINDY